MTSNPSRIVTISAVTTCDGDDTFAWQTLLHVVVSIGRKQHAVSGQAMTVKYESFWPMCIVRCRESISPTPTVSIISQTMSENANDGEIDSGGRIEAHFTTLSAYYTNYLLDTPTY
jgi:hypothetical protein